MAESAAGQGILGVDQLQRQVDALTTSVGQLTSELSSFVTRITSALSGVSNATAGAATASSGAMSGQPAGRATGTGTGGYAAMASSGAPTQTMGQNANGAAAGTGSPGAPVAAGSGGISGRFRQFLSFGGGGGGGGAGGGGVGGMSRGATYTALGAGVVQAAAMYGTSHLNTFLTMNTMANQQVMSSGLQSGGYGASVRTATSMVYGSGGRNLNVTAASVQDAAQAAGTLSYAMGAPMYNANGSPNSAWVGGQSSMYQMGYANPTMSQAAVAASMQSVYSPRSAMMMSALGYGSSIGTGGTRTSMSSIADQVMSRTFPGQSGAVSSQTMAAALSQGGSLDSNLQYLASQSGWSSSTVGMLEGYLKDRNVALGKGVTSSQFDTLMTQASSGDKNAQSQLSQYGIGASTVQSMKDLQGAQTATLADQSGSYNDALQTSTGLLTQFNRALGNILNNTGLSSLIGGTSGLSTPFGSAAAGVGTLAGLTGLGGGSGGSTGGGSGMLSSLAMNLGLGVAARGSGTLARAGAGALGSGWRAAFGARAAAGVGAAGGMSVAGRLGVAGAGLAVGYAGVQGNNALWSNVAGHTGSGDDWVTDVGKGAGNTLAYAASGALIGSVIPGVGTAVGAGVGAAIGLGQSVWDWWNDKSGYSARSSSTVNNAATSPSVSVTGSNAMGGYTTGSIGGGTDNGTTSTAGPSSVTPAPGASGATTATLQRVISAAVAQVGKEYEYGATGPNTFDCSGLMQFAYAQGGIHIPRTSEQQMTTGSPVKPEAALPGDLLFPYPGHVMMCVSPGKVVEARHTGTTIYIRSYSPSEFIACRRIIQLASEGGTQNAAASGGNAATGASPATSATVTGGGLAAGTSELDAINANAQSATTDALTASLRITAADTPFGLTSSTLPNSLTGNPLSNPFSGGNNAAVSSGMTATNNTVKDIYGHTYKVPSGARPAGNVASWISQALSDMGMAPSWTADVKDIVTGESAGDPWNINLTDSNAAHGTPSEGLMQTIGPTFAAHKMPGHTDIWNPVDNIIAGVRYAIGRYKNLDNVPGVQAVKAGRPYVGYAAGAWDLPADQIAKLHKGEMVLPASAAQSVRNAVISDSLGAGKGSTAAQSSGVTLHFRPGSIQITMGQVSAQTAQQAGTAIVDSIVSDPRIKKMAVGL